MTMTFYAAQNLKSRDEEFDWLFLGCPYVRTAGWWGILTEKFAMNVSNGKRCSSPMEKSDAFSRRNENRCSTNKMLTSHKVSDLVKGFHNRKRNDFSIEWPGVQIQGSLLSSYYMEMILHSPEVCSQDKWIYTN